MSEQEQQQQGAPSTHTIDTNQQQGPSVLGNLTASASNAGRMVAGQVTGQVDSVLKKLHFSEYKSAVLAELFGTFILTLTTSLSQSSVGQLSPIAIGFMYSSLIFTYHYISGAHFNPAMTLGIWLSRDGPATLVWHKALLYWIFQVIGASLAAFYSLMVYGVDFAVPTTPDSFYPGIFRVLITEAVFTFMLVSVMLHVAHSKQKENSFHGFAVGMMLMAATLANNGGVLNPAIATALIVVKCFTGSCVPVLHLWVFWAGELAGCIFAAIFYNVASATLEEQENQERQQLEDQIQQNNNNNGENNNNNGNDQEMMSQQQQGGITPAPLQQQASLRYGDTPQDMNQMQMARNENATSDTPRGGSMSASNGSMHKQPTTTNNNNNNNNSQQNYSTSNNNNNGSSSNNSNSYSPSSQDFAKSTAPPTPAGSQHHHHYSSNDNQQHQQQYGDQHQLHQNSHGSSQGNGNNSGEDASPLYE